MKGIFENSWEGKRAGHGNIPKRMPESSYSCYCLQKHEKKNEKERGMCHIPAYPPSFLWHYKIFCVNVKYGIQYGFRIFYLITLQNEENYEREESCSA